MAEATEVHFVMDMFLSTYGLKQYRPPLIINQDFIDHLLNGCRGLMVQRLHLLWLTWWRVANCMSKTKAFLYLAVGKIFLSHACYDALDSMCFRGTGEAMTW